MSYIKLDRALRGWRYKDKPEYVALWVDLLLNANWEEKQWHDITVHRGELITSYANLAKNTGLSVQNVRTIIGNLLAQELTCKSTNKYTLINIIKWEEYQCEEEKPTSTLTNNQQTTNKQLTTTKEYKEYKNIKNNILPIYDTSINPPSNEERFEEIMRSRKC